MGRRGKEKREREVRVKDEIGEGADEMQGEPVPKGGSLRCLDRLHGLANETIIYYYPNEDIK